MNKILARIQSSLYQLIKQVIISNKLRKVCRVVKGNLWKPSLVALRNEISLTGERRRRSRRVCVGRGRRRRCASQQGRVGGGSWGKDASELVGGRRISHRKSQCGEQKTAGNVFLKSEKN